MDTAQLKKIFSESKKTIREKGFLKSLILIFVTTLIVTIFLPVGIIYYVLYTYTDYRVVATTDPFDKFPEEWTISKGKIVNTVRETYIYPDDPLEYQATVTNPKNEIRQLAVFLNIFKGGNLVGDPITQELSVSANDKITINVPIFLKEDGVYRLEIKFVFDMNNEETTRPNKTFHVENLQVQSLSDKLLADANATSFGGYVTILLVTGAGNIFTVFYLRKQHKQTETQLRYTRQELESRLGADLQVVIGETNLKMEGDKFQGKVIFSLKNNGVISARKIRVYFKDPTSSLDISQLVRDKQEIKKTLMPIQGILTSGSNSTHLRHDTLREAYAPYQIAIWVEYDCADVKNTEFIQIVEVNAQSHSLLALYDKTEIDEEIKRQKNMGL